MNAFHLYRIKIERYKDQPLFSENIVAGKEILKAIERKPSAELRKGQTWHIGNVQSVDNNGYVFALGKTAMVTREVYDDTRGDFLDEPGEDAPYTHVAIDIALQVCAIAHKSKIAQNPDKLANNLARLLNSDLFKRDAITFTLSMIRQPDEFLELVRNAIKITHFEMTFSPPNPWDVVGFHKQQETFLESIAGKNGVTKVSGKQLDKTTIENLTRSIAASGDTAKAKIQSKDDKKPLTKKLSENPLILSTDEVNTTDQRKELLDKLREAYHRIRSKE